MAQKAPDLKFMMAQAQGADDERVAEAEKELNSAWWCNMCIIKYCGYYTCCCCLCTLGTSCCCGPACIGMQAEKMKKNSEPWAEKYPLLA
mmetsp:Transcript_54638/g.98075  ORF Transcript_54638/g.98075 Transcript_54638/m.98075 type:complete len:90 (-) Transcript_54638:467-736(-)